VTILIIIVKRLAAGSPCHLSFSTSKLVEIVINGSPGVVHGCSVRFEGFPM